MSDLLTRIRERSAALTSCAGHVFKQIPAREAVGANVWRCEVCGQSADPGYAKAYMDGLKHAAKGHTLERAVGAPNAEEPS